MTTVVFDGRVLAADRLIGDFWTASKIWRLPDGSYFTGCGLYDHLTEVAEWLSKGHKEDKKPWLPEDQESSFAVVCPDGSSHWLSYPYLRPIPFKEAQWAIGSGAPYALGAMATGVGARRACEIAIGFDPNSGKGIDWVRVVPPTKKGGKE